MMKDDTYFNHTLPSQEVRQSISNQTCVVWTVGFGVRFKKIATNAFYMAKIKVISLWLRDFWLMVVNS